MATYISGYTFYIYTEWIVFEIRKTYLKREILLNKLIEIGN